MVDIDAVRRMALALGDADDFKPGQLAFSIGGKGFAWSYLERIHPKKPRVARLDVLAVRCPIERKELLVEAAPDRFFDDDHYRGYAAVLVRLAHVDEAELQGLLADAAELAARKKPGRRPGKR